MSTRLRHTGITLRVKEHPTLDLAAFVSHFASPLAGIPSPDWLPDLLRVDADTPVSSGDKLRTAVRDMLRFGGYKPAGRGKPASEYLLKVASEGGLTSINLVVDVCNIVSLHSGIPISVIDLGKAANPFEVRLGRDDEQYVFNASGQTIRVGGLLCLCDARGPCANAVKDAQRTKTDEATEQTLSILWGTRSMSDQTRSALGWYRSLVERAGGATEAVLPA
jgi:DNA/RNA-binding domain of Phe-tRNA-synthetase-like protein